MIPKVKALILLSIFFICVSKAIESNNTVLADILFSQQQPYYIKIKQGDSKYISINQITQNWKQAFDFQGQLPDFCRKISGALYTRQEDVGITIQNKTAVQSIAVNNRNGIIFTFLRSQQGIYSLKFNQTARRFDPIQHITDNTLKNTVKASKVLYTANQEYLSVVTTTSFVLFQLIKDKNQVSFSYQLDKLYQQSKMSAMKNVKILTYSQNIILFNVDTSIVMINRETKKHKTFDFKEKIQDITLVQANKKANLLYLVQNKGLYMTDFIEINKVFQNDQLQFQLVQTNPLNQSQSAKLGKKILQIGSNGERSVALIQDVSSSQGEMPYYIEYYIDDNFSFNQISTGYFAKYYQNQKEVQTLLISKNYSLVWMNNIGYVFPIKIGQNKQYAQTYSSASINAFAIYQPQNSEDTYLLGEEQSGMILQKISYKSPAIQCDLEQKPDRKLQQAKEGDQDVSIKRRGKGKYNFSIKVLGKTCQSQKANTIDPRVSCSRDYKVRLRVVDDDHSSYSKVIIIVSIVLGIIALVGLILMIVLIRRCKKQKRLARSYQDLSRRREFQVLNENNQEELEMRNVGIFDGFERAAVREYDDKNDEFYRPQQIQQQQIQAQNLQTEEDIQKTLE